MLEVLGTLAIYTFFISVIVLTSFALHYLHLLILCMKNRNDNNDNNESLNSSYFPKVTVQIPIYNEYYVVERIIDSVVKFDYPKDCLEIQVLDDSTDKTSELAEESVKFHRDQGINIKFLHRTERVGFKAGALGEGLKIAEGELIAIFDADFMPEEDFLRKTVPFFKNSNIGVLQTRWGHVNKNYSMLTKFQAFFLDVHFRIEQVGLSAGGYFNKFNGTAGIWRKKCIEDAGGWNSDTLIEDIDLSYRAQLKGWKIRYVEDIVTPAELPVTMSAFRSQQFRWSKGAIQHAKKNLLKVMKAKLPISTKIHVFFTVFDSSLSIFSLLIALSSVLIIFNKNNESLLLNISFFLLTCFTFACAGIVYLLIKKDLGNSYKAFFNYLLYFIIFYAMLIGMSLNSFVAVFSGLIGKVTPFVRTPKFSITDSKSLLKSSIYASRKIEPILIAEIFFVVLFAFAVYLDFMYNKYLLILPHLMMLFSYSTIVFFSLRQVIPRPKKY